MYSSDRLSYREITLDDASVIVEWRSDPSVYKYFTQPHKVTVEEHINWFQNSYKSNDNRIDFMALNSEGRPVGIFGIRRDSDHSLEAEVSYILGPDFYGQGYCTEGVKWLMDYCRQIWKCTKVTAEIHKDNIRSVNLVKRLGFEQQETNGEFVIYGKQI